MKNRELIDEIIRVTDLIYQNRKDTQEEVAVLLRCMMATVETAEAGACTDIDVTQLLGAMGDALDAMQKGDMVLFADHLVFGVKPALEK